jgi:hypothetical protein
MTVTSLSVDDSRTHENPIKDGGLLWVAGGRDYHNVELMKWTLDPFIRAEWSLVTGAARGADLIAEAIWRTAELSYTGIPARWAEHGRSAGPIRNRVIAEMLPDLLIHFPGGPGTANAVVMAEIYGIKVQP